MRQSRQKMILEIIEKNEIDTQEALSAKLVEAGFDVTQATISRDIRDLQLVKILSSNGGYKYSANPNSETMPTGRYVNILKDTVRSAKGAGNLLVVKTISGCAPAAAEAIDILKFEHIVGTIAGDNTILLIIDEADNVAGLEDKFNSYRSS